MTMDVDLKKKDLKELEIGKIENSPNKLSLLQKKLEKSQNKSRELQEENKLLLLQLHQVQEELERYFFANQKMSTIIKKFRKTMDKARIQITKLTRGKNS